MKQARLYADYDLRVEQVDEPEPGPGQVLIHVGYAGICGSDLHSYNGFVKWPDTPHPLTAVNRPFQFGHEFSGTIAALGPECTSSLKVGDRVAIEPLLSCRECKLCKEGSYNLCPKTCFIGYHWPLGGGLGDQVVVPEDKCFVLPDHLSLEEGAMVEPLSVAWFGVKRTEFQAGQSALVLGAGPIGLFTVKILKALGASFIAVSEVAEGRREAAKRFGADVVYNPLKDDLLPDIQKRTGGWGVDVCIELAGVQPAVDAAFSCVRPGGRIAIVAIHSKPVSFDAVALTRREITVTGSRAYRHCYPEVIDALASGKLNCEGLVTAVVDLVDVKEKGFEALLASPEKHIKILVKP